MFVYVKNNQLNLDFSKNRKTDPDISLQLNEGTPELYLGDTILSETLLEEEAE